MQISLNLIPGQLPLHLSLEGVQLSLETPEALALAAHLEYAADDYFTSHSGFCFTLQASGAGIRLFEEAPDLSSVQSSVILTAGQALEAAHFISQAARQLHGIRAGRESGPSFFTTTLTGKMPHAPFSSERTPIC